MQCSQLRIYNDIYGHFFFLFFFFGCQSISLLKYVHGYSYFGYNVKKNLIFLKMQHDVLAKTH